MLYMNERLIVTLSSVTKERMKPNTCFVQNALTVFPIQYRSPKEGNAVKQACPIFPFLFQFHFPDTSSLPFFPPHTICV